MRSLYKIPIFLSCFSFLTNVEAKVCVWVSRKKWYCKKMMKIKSRNWWEKKGVNLDRDFAMCQVLVLVHVKVLIQNGNGWTWFLDIKYILEYMLCILNCSKQLSCSITTITLWLFWRIKVADMVLEKSLGKMCSHNLIQCSL